MSPVIHVPSCYSGPQEPLPDCYPGAPPKRYDVIYADPAWTYENKKTGGSHKSGASQHYPTMTVEEICALPVPALGKKSSVCFLWVTVPMLDEGRQVLKAWGYKYKTLHVWHKVGRKGLGYWWRGEVELLLFGVRGKVKAFRMNESNIVAAPVGRHSEKPDLFRRRIERAAEKGVLLEKVELFARVHPTGWDVWGFDVAGSIDLEAYKPPAP